MPTEGITLARLRPLQPERTASDPSHDAVAARSADQLALHAELESARLLVQWNATHADYPLESSIQALFEAQAARTPDAIAVVHAAQHHTYEELNRNANRLAHHLRKLGVGPDTRVGLCVERGLEMVVGLLAILKAGGAYVPLDPAYPADRLSYMLGDSKPVALLIHLPLSTRTALYAVLNTPRMRLLNLQADAWQWAEESQHNPLAGNVALTSKHLAYVIYTSGSTGLPKGVAIEHRSAVNFICWSRSAFSPELTAQTLFVTSLNFDLSVFELFVPLASGGCVTIVKNALEIPQLVVQGTLLNTVPSAISAMLDAAGIPRGVRNINLAGEPLKQPLVERIFATTDVASVCNLYGPTETTTYSTWVRMTRQQGFVAHIGRPIANTRIYILDEHRQPVAIGVAGELYIGGTGVARGYLNREQLTAERFMSDPFNAELDARMYRTGDVGRYLPDGNIEYLGRNDQQVKLRGFRIELGEIEARLAEHRSVRDAAVMVREDSSGERQLVAYVTGTGEPAIDVEALREHVWALLPEYMVPAAYVVLASLPLTLNGKLDRKALPAPGLQAYVARKYEAPVGEVERALAGIWAEVLKLERVGRHDNFFELGGHSLLAARMVARVRQQFGVQVTQRELFMHPQVAGFATALGSAERAAASTLLPADRSQPLPLSWAQRGLWFLHRLDAAADSAYHLPFAYRLSGTLRIEMLRWALDGLLQRHASLRTTFASAQDRPVQIVGKYRSFELREQDLSELPAEQQQAAASQLHAIESRRCFDFATGPLIRGVLLRLAPDVHELLIVQHHIISDGWSMGVWLQELAALYNAKSRGQGDPLPALALQYADYAVWQHQDVQLRAIRRQLPFWGEYLRDAPALLELPADRPRPAIQSYRGDRIAVSLDEELTAALHRFCHEHAVTPFMTLLAGWSALLSRLTGQDDIVVGTPVANRLQPEVEGLIGLFVNTLALRINLQGDPSVRALVANVKENTLAVYEHQDVPFDCVVEALRPSRSLSYNPLFQTMLALNNTPDAGEISLLDLSLTPIVLPQASSHFDLSLLLDGAGSRLAGSIEYASDLFDRPSVQRIADYFPVLLRAMLADDALRVSQLPLLPAPELQRLLLHFNDTAQPFAAEQLIHELFEEQVQRSPDAIAVVYETRTSTYGELNRQSNRLAHRLRKLGVSPDRRVAVCAQRGIEMVVGLLAILKAGGAYVPLDPAYPADRLGYLLRDCTPLVLLTCLPVSARTALLAALDGNTVSLDLQSDADTWAAEAHTNPSPGSVGLLPNHLAYVIYTSGSTGLPKGVMVEHANVCNLIHAHVRNCGLTAEDRVLQFASFAFDASVEEIFPPLSVGARMVLRPQQLAIPDGRFVQFLRDERITVAELPTAFWHQWAEQDDHQRDAHQDWLRLVVVGGEKAERRHLERWHAVRHRCSCGWLNTYGPTEATVYSSALLVAESDELRAGEIPIGRPIANTRIYILDEHRQPVPIGVAGELYIGGAGVARGYLNREQLTAERFMSDPFNAELDARMYRTGDVGRYLPDGNIEYLGRNDQQVKLRGFRIELGEIEARLAAHRSVRDAVVMAREDSSGERQLVAYVTGTGEPAIDVEALREHVRALLPEYMVPAAYVVLASLPLTLNGKLDRKALPAPGLQAYVARKYEAPVGEVESALAGIWAEVLKLERVGRHDNFFELGGHSLLAVTLMERLRRADLQVDVRAVFAAPTLAALAAATEEMRELLV